MNTDDTALQPLVRHIDSITFSPCVPGVDAYMRVLLGESDDMPHFFTREFEIRPGGSIPAHRHPDIEHQQLVQSGELSLQLGENWTKVRAGHCIYIPAMTIHAYKNETDHPLRFVCVVPKTTNYTTEWMEHIS